jgi:hypothetical protein
VTRRLAAAAAGLMLLGGCGMYGDLYMERPDAPVPEITEAPPIAAEDREDPETPTPRRADEAPEGGL